MKLYCGSSFCVFHIRVVILDPQKYIFLIFKNVYLVEVTPPGS